MRLFKRFEKRWSSLSVTTPPGPQTRAWRTPAVFLALLPFCATAQSGNIAAANIAATNYAVVAQGPNSRVWATSVASVTNGSGRVIYHTNSYTEIASGLNHLVNGQWMAASENIQITSAGGAATNGQHQVYFAADINASNAVQIVTPEGDQLNTHIMGLSYYDAGTGSNVLFAELQDSVGQVVNNNQVVYSNAFTNCNADVRYTYRRSGIEQDIVVQQQLPNPDVYGLNPSNTWLQVWTEFTDPPTPAIEPILDGADERLDFGMMKMERGRAFILGNESNPAPVNKAWRTVGGRTFLVEQVQFDDVATQLQSFPASSGNGNGSDGSGTQQIRFRGFPKQLPPRPKLAKRANESLKLAQTQVPEKGLVLDYALNGSITNLTLQGDTTYFVTGPVNLYGTTTIEGGTVVKFTNSSASPSINLYGPVNCETGPYRMAMFTAMDDNTVGLTVTGSSGTPSGYYAQYALYNQYTGSNLTLHHLRLSYSTYGLNLFSAYMTNWLEHIQFVNDDNAVLASLRYSGSFWNDKAIPSQLPPGNCSCVHLHYNAINRHWPPW